MGRQLAQVQGHVSDGHSIFLLLFKFNNSISRAGLMGL